MKSGVSLTVTRYRCALALADQLNSAETENSSLVALADPAVNSPQAAKSVGLPNAAFCRNTRSLLKGLGSVIVRPVVMSSSPPT